MEITEEQRKRIEENRQRALAIREAKRRAEEGRPVNGTASSGTGAANPAQSRNNCNPGGFSRSPNKQNATNFPWTPKAVNGEKHKANQVTPYTRTSPVRKEKKTIQAKISLRNKERVELFFKYDKDVVDAIKQVSSATYDEANKCWHFMIGEYGQLLTKLKKLELSNIHVNFTDSIPQKVIGILTKYNAPTESVDLTDKLKPSMVEKLYDFQKQGISFGISRNGRVLIADDMGLGKTVQALALACWYRSDWPLLIICPSSLKYQWKKSILMWIDDIAENDISIIEERKRGFPETSVIISSYEMISRFRQEAPRVQVSFVILDESHFIKNDKAIRTKAALAFAKKSKRLVLLTGTPAMSRPMELFTQISAIDSKIFPNKHEFGMRYCDGRPETFRRVGDQQIYSYRGSSNTEELKLLLETTVMIRRLKRDVLLQLPPKRRVMVVLDVDLSAHVRQQMNAYSTQISSIHTKSEKALYQTLLFDWYNKTAEVKLKPVCDYVEHLVEQGKKFICFAHHKLLIDGLAELLEKKDCPHIRIDGSTPGEMRQKCCDYFQEREECKVALISMSAAGMGINLTAAQLVVFAELFWNPGMLTQAEDRAHRIGQQDSVLIQYLNAPSTVDDVIWPMITKKLKVLSEVGLTRDNFKEAGITDSKQRMLEEFFPTLPQVPADAWTTP